MSSIKLICLNKSRSARLLWLFEELGLKYDTQYFQRDENYRAPKELKQLHPLGRAPLIQVTDDATKKVTTLAESGNIIDYILTHFDKQHKLINEKNEWDVKYFLHYVEGSLLPPFLIDLLCNVSGEKAPWPSNYVVGFVTGKIQQAYSSPELTSHLNYLNSTLERNGGYLASDGSFSAADIMAFYPLVRATKANESYKTEYPHLVKWVETIEQRPAYKRAKEVAIKNGDIW